MLVVVGRNTQSLQQFLGVEPLNGFNFVPITYLKWAPNNAVMFQDWSDEHFVGMQ